MEDFVFYKVDYDTTLAELTADPLSIFEAFKNNVSELLNYESDVYGYPASDEYGNPVGAELFYDTSLTNFDRIVDMYSDADLTAEEAKIKSKQITLIKAGTMLIVPKSAITINLLALTGRNLFVKDVKSFDAFYGSYLDLLQRDGFTLKYKPWTASDVYNTIDIREYAISVWVWSRAYSQDGTLLVDLSNFVETCTTNVNGTQNTFSLRLSVSEEYPTEMGDEY